MQSEYRFSNLLGTVHTDGNLLFDPVDGTTLLTPAYNKITTFDLANNVSSTTQEGCTHNIRCNAISKDGSLLFCVAENGEAVLMKHPQGIVLQRFNLREEICYVAFSEDSRAIAVAGVRTLRIFRIDSDLSTSLSSDMVTVAKIKIAAAEYTYVDWIGSSYLVVGSMDAAVRLVQVDIELCTHKIIGIDGIKAPVVACFFIGLPSAVAKKLAQKSNTNSTDADDADDERLSKKKLRARLQELSPYTSNSTVPLQKDPSKILVVTKTGTVSIAMVSKGRWTVDSEYSKRIETRKTVMSAAYNVKQSLLLLGCRGDFVLFKVDPYDHTLTRLQVLSISDSAISSVAINKSGDWLAMGVKNRGQLLIWDWQTKTYLLKQQGHQTDLTAIGYNTDGTQLASGDGTGRIKVWDTKSGQSFVTFLEHNNTVTGLVFARPPSSRDAVLFSSSVDGTCRAYDLLRCKNFRTYVSPSPAAFTTLAVDPSAEILAAASQDNFEIYLWNVQTAVVLDILKAHTAPVVSMAFSPNHTTLATGSWDGTVRLWDFVSSGGNVETLRHSSEVLAIAYRPDGTQIAVATIDGTLTFWDPSNAQTIAVIEARRDILVDHSVPIAKQNKMMKKHFSTLAYTADGTSVLCGGKSQFLYMYSVEQGVLLRRFPISTNLSFADVVRLDANTYEKYTPSTATEAGDIRTFDVDGQKYASIGNQALPGSSLGLRPSMECHAIAMSPTNREFAAATSEGVVVFSVDTREAYLPIDVDPSITSESILEKVNEQDYAGALLMAIRLNEPTILTQVFNAVPPKDVQLVVKALPANYIKRFMEVLASEIERSTHLEFNLEWTKNLFFTHGVFIRAHSVQLQAMLRAIMRAIAVKQDSLSKICEQNRYNLEFIASFFSAAGKRSKIQLLDKETSKKASAPVLPALITTAQSDAVEEEAEDNSEDKATDAVEEDQAEVAGDDSDSSEWEEELEKEEQRKTKALEDRQGYSKPFQGKGRWAPRKRDVEQQKAKQKQAEKQQAASLNPTKRSRGKSTADDQSAMKRVKS